MAHELNDDRHTDHKEQQPTNDAGMATSVEERLLVAQRTSTGAMRPLWSPESLTHTAASCAPMLGGVVGMVKPFLPTPVGHGDRKSVV